jgi:hypothetical protein
MKMKSLGRVARVVAFVKAPRLTHLLRHPIKGPKNLLALRGAKSLLKTRGAALTAAVATTALTLPLAARALRNQSEV